jgi:hypothetical protein
MRIWSLHPQYLDAKGLVALWRETLLAKHVLLGKTKGYTNHPQLNRFKEAQRPVDAIDQYLTEVYNEAVHRGYNFDKSKINLSVRKQTISVTTGQVYYERAHLEKKLKLRDPVKLKEIKTLKELSPHPIFKIIKGEIEEWEII